MRDTRKRFQDFFILDYRHNILEYHIVPVAIRLIQPFKRSRKALVKVFYKENVTPKLAMLAEHFSSIRQPFKVTLGPRCGMIIYWSICLEAKGFPVTPFAKKFLLSDILERNLDRMDVAVVSRSEMRITDSSFFGLANQLEGHLTVGTMDEKTKEVIKDEEVVLPIIVQGDLEA